VAFVGALLFDAKHAGPLVASPASSNRVGKGTVMNEKLKLTALAMLLAGASLASANPSRAPTAPAAPSVIAAVAHSMPCASHAELTAAQDVAKAPKGNATQVAGATDIRQCHVECTPGNGCELVCLHLTY
jgi:hypothetical protein